MVIKRIDGTELTKIDEEIRELEIAIRLTEILIDGGRHCDTKMYEKAIEGYKDQIKKLQEEQNEI